MLDKILGSDSAMKIMFHLIHYGEIYPSAVAKDYHISLSGVQKQFQRFDEAGILVSKLVGKLREYFFNKKSPVITPMRAIKSLVPMMVFHSQNRCYVNATSSLS